MSEKADWFNTVRIAQTDKPLDGLATVEYGGDTAADLAVFAREQANDKSRLSAYEAGRQAPKIITPPAPRKRQSGDATSAVAMSLILQATGGMLPTGNMIQDDFTHGIAQALAHNGYPDAARSIANRQQIHLRHPNAC